MLAEQVSYPTRGKRSHTFNAIEMVAALASLNLVIGEQQVTVASSTYFPMEEFGWDSPV